MFSCVSLNRVLQSAALWPRQNDWKKHTHIHTLVFFLKLEESSQKRVEQTQIEEYFGVIFLFFAAFLLENWEHIDPGVRLPAYCYKNESHETCSCQYLGGGLLGDTNRLGGEGVHVHFLEDMAFLSTFWILLALPKVRFPKINQHFSKGWSLCGLVWGFCYPPEEPDILSS